MGIAWGKGALSMERSFITDFLTLWGITIAFLIFSILFLIVLSCAVIVMPIALTLSVFRMVWRWLTNFI